MNGPIEDSAKIIIIDTTSTTCISIITTITIILTVFFPFLSKFLNHSQDQIL
jgi:hypothetical protein